MYFLFQIEEQSEKQVHLHGRTNNLAKQLEVQTKLAGKLSLSVSVSNSYNDFDLFSRGDLN